MIYTKENALIRNEPTTKRGNVTILRAVVYGNSKQRISESELVNQWNAILPPHSPVPTALMLAKAKCESNFYPYLFRYEIGQHLDTSKKWLSKDSGNTEFDATSGGLFQILGKNAKAYNYYSWETLQSTKEQLKLFNLLMTDCIKRASKFKPAKGFDIYYNALNIYAYGTNPKFINWKNALIDENHSKFQEYLIKYPLKTL